ncbi:hypothetical protein AAVH_29677 [Aphelenchoides avenae]|nr:hypothetical protein AAVH_29677 [Aphelenchus avenae]
MSSLVFLRTYRGGDRGSRPPEGKTVVDVSSEVWQLLKEHDVPATITSVYNVHIETTQTTSKKVQLTLRGRNAEKIARMLADPPRKMAVHEEVDAWLLASGPNGVRVADIRKRSGALVRMSQDMRSVLLVGSSAATLAAKSMIDECDYIEEFDIDNFVAFYLINNRAFHLKRLGVCYAPRKFDTYIHLPPLTADSDPYRMVESVIVGESKHNVDDILAITEECCIEEFDIDYFIGFYLINNDAFHQKRLSIETNAVISAVPGRAATKWKAVVVGPTESVKLLRSKLDGLHVMHGQIPQAVYGWLTNKSKGANCERSTDLNRKFGTCMSTEPLSDDTDPARMVRFMVVGEHEENVAQVFAAIANIVVEKMNITKLQEEFWMGHEDEQSRNRSHHRLEDATDTYIEVDFDASCMHITGRPEDIKRAVDRIRKNQHIKLRTSEISLAAGNYVARIRPKLENDDVLQIHLRYEGMLPGTYELRRLHRVDSDADDAKADEADQKSMQAIDLHAVVLEVHESCARLLVEQSRRIESSEGVGIGVSKDVVNGRVLVNIAGSATTVERGLKAVIRRLASHRPHMVGDIRLRRIKGQVVDTTGFEEATQATEEDLRNCKRTFEWERLTRERWQLVGRSSTERKRSAVPEQHKASENAENNRS